jgi:hypothetical protein
MDIVSSVMVVLFGAFALSAWSCARSYFDRGKIRGIEEAVRELQVGMSAELGTELAPDVQKALANLHTCLVRRPGRRVHGTDPIHSHLWRLGAALGEACWLKGHGAGIRRKTPAEGRFRVDLSLSELLQLGGLANLGFQHMMPNMRIIDMRRFTGEDDAVDASRSISKIEAAIPKKYRPDLVLQAESRECLIDDWWRPVTHKATA